jgi:hypothetical protein
MDQVTIVTATRQGIPGVLSLQLIRLVMTTETLLIGRDFQQERLLRPVGCVAAIAPCFDRLMANIAGKDSLIMTRKTELWRGRAQQRRIDTVVGLVAFKTLPLGHRLMNDRYLGIFLNIPVTGEAQPGFIGLQVDFTNQTVIAVTRPA